MARVLVALEGLVEMSLQQVAVVVVEAVEGLVDIRILIDWIARW